MRKNIYDCPKGHKAVTVDIDKGVTPFMLQCRKNGCREMSKSRMYVVEGADDLLPVTHEWYKPTDKAFRKLDPAMKDHVKNGGLMLRRKLRE